VIDRNKCGTLGGDMMTTNISTHRDSWCILRTSGGRTLLLAASLAGEGFDVWTPVAITRQRVRKGPTHVVVERTAPIAPTFVFGRASLLPDFARIRSAPVSRHPPFSIFHWDNRVPLVPESSLAVLRATEAEAMVAIERAREDVARAERQRERASTMRTEHQRRKALRAERREFQHGALVSVAGAPALAGLSGKVIESNGTSALVAFGGSLVMTIEAWQLSPFELVTGHH